MKKLKKFVALLMVFAMMLTAVSCGKAPAQNEKTENSENPVSDTQQQDSQEIKNDIPTGDTVEEVETGTIIEEDGTVRQVDMFESEDGWVTFIVDAVVEGSEITELPIVSVVPNHYDSAELKQIAEAMAQGNTVYGYTETLTKAELKNIRKDFEDLVISYTNRTADGAINATDEELEEAIAKWQAYIDAIDADMVNAPDEMPYTEPVYEYGPESRYDEGKTYLRDHYIGKNGFRALYTQDGRIMDIYACDITTSGTYDIFGEETYVESNFNIIYTNVNNKRNGSFGGTYTQKTPFTEEEKEKAIKEVLQIVENMGMGDWKMVVADAADPAEGREKFGSSMVFKFYPAYYDVPMSPESSDFYAWSPDENRDVPAFSEAPYLYIVYSNGSILDIALHNDVDAISETEKKPLLSYEEILEVIYGYAAKTWDFSSIYAISPYQRIQDEEYAYNFYINKMSLQYIRTVSGEDPDHYDLVPVWMVYGHPNVVKTFIGNATIEGTSIAPGYHGNAESDMIPIMTINAYDGTLINSTMLS